MTDFNLNQSGEYLQIKERQQFINQAITNSSSSDLISAAASVVPLFLANIQKPGISLLSSKDSSNGQSKRNAIINALFTPQNLETVTSTLKNDIIRDYGLLYPLSNYSFAPVIFQLDCETEELKKYRALNQPNEDSRLKIARINRRKAEESYRNGQIDEAIRLFKESEEKNETDYTTLYQLGLIYFFEKADYKESCNYFKRTAKYAQNKSTVIHLCSSIFFALLLRLFGSVTNNFSLIEEAYNSLMQVYNANNQNFMLNYALAQACAALASKSGYAPTARNIIKRLIKANEIAALQMTFDIAFDSFLPQIAEVISELIGETKNSAIDSFKQIDEAIDRISHMSKYMVNSSRLVTIKTEYNELQTRINASNYFEIKSVDAQAKKTMESFQALFQEINENRAYFELREITECVVTEFKKDEEAAKKPVVSLETDLQAAKAELEKLEKNYPPDREEKIIKKSVVIKGKLETIEQKVEASISWRKQRGFLFLKSIIGCFFSILIVLIIICSLILLHIEIKPITYVIISVFLLFTPLYGTIGDEVFYYNVEMKRRRLHEKVEKLEKLIEVKIPRVEEEIQKLKEKHATVLAEKTKLSAGRAMTVLEAGINGNYEQIKRFLGGTA